jgi:glycosyltransferase involved in cell wall biosynthesis
VAFATFVIPTLGRESLARALESLVAQTDPDWQAVVIGDGLLSVPGIEVPAGKVTCISAPRLRSAGLVRNVAFERGLVTSPWTAFLDDDDTVSPDYVRWLREQEDGHDVVIFRMLDPRLGILPDLEEPRIVWGQVGLSFAVRTRWFVDEGKRFIREEHPDDPARAKNEDIRLLEDLRDAGAALHIAPQIAYFVESEN